MHHNREHQPGEHDTHLDTNFLLVVVIALLCYSALIFVTFLSHAFDSSIGSFAQS